MGSDWRRLGAEVRRTRVLAGYDRAEEFAREVGTSARTLLKLERGQRVAMTTVYKIEAALGWAAGDAANLLDGQPRGMRPPGSEIDQMREDASIVDAVRKLAEHEGQVRAILNNPELTDEERVRFIRIVFEMNGRQMPLNQTDDSAVNRVDH